MSLYESLHTIPLDALSEKVGGRHRLTFLVSQRMRALNGGAPLLVERKDGESLLAAVCREVDEGKIWLEMPEEPVTPVESSLDLLGLGDDIMGGDA